MTRGQTAAPGASTWWCCESVTLKPKTGSGQSIPSCSSGAVTSARSGRVLRPGRAPGPSPHAYGRLVRSEGSIEAISIKAIERSEGGVAIGFARPPNTCRENLIGDRACCGGGGLGGDRGPDDLHPVSLRQSRASGCVNDQ